MEFFGIGFPELILILIIILIIVGPDKLPEVAGTIGRTVRKLKEATTELSKDFKEMSDDVKSSGEEVKQVINNKTGLTGDLKEMVREAREVKRGINTALNPQRELADSIIKEIAKDVTSVGKEIQNVAKEISTTLEQTAEEKPDTLAEEPEQKDADS